MIALAIFSMVVASVMRFSEYVSRRVVTIRNEVEHLDDLVGFLEAFSADIRSCRQIIYTSPVEVGLWRLDENADSAVESAETVGYAWDGANPGLVMRQAGEDTSVVLHHVRDFRLTFDQLSPNTRHVVVDIEVGKFQADIRRFHYSVNLRASELQ